MEFIKGNAIWITPILEAIFQEYSADIFRNINTAKMYVVVEFEKNELDSSSLHSSRKAYPSETWYDAQYTGIKATLSNNKQ
jgi:hypothetical protein